MAHDATPERTRRRRPIVVWVCAGLGVLATLGWLFGPVWAEGIRVAIPSPISAEVGRSPERARADILREGDHLFSVWAVGRNAYTLLESPLSLFDAELCHPVANSLALGEPMIAMGLLGVPAWWISEDPVATYNVSLAAMTALAALAMFALVWRWTGDAAAGMVAGILYGFGEVKLRELVHPYAYDTAWTVLALLFAREWIRAGRWRDALATALFCGLQLTASFYPLLAGIVIAVPLGVSLVVIHGASKLKLSQVAAVLAVLVAFASWVYGPFLEIRANADVAHLHETPPYYGIWSTFLPGGWNFPGWLAIGLVAVGLVFGGPHPRVALCAGALLAAVFATGGNVMAQRWGDPVVALPNPYEWLGSLVPGLDQVRAPAALFVGVHWSLCLLAGLGAAGLLARLSGRRSISAGVALVALTWVVTLRPATLGFDPPVDPRPLRVRPPAGDLRMADRLQRSDGGAIVEIPLAARDLMARSAAVLLSGYHHRPTSACHSSQRPAQSKRVERTSARLPAADALAELQSLGFTTLLVHHSPRRPADGVWAGRFAAASTGADAPLRLFYSTPRMTAYSIATPAP